MPFISKDWRSPGEEWVKTEEGWEKKKILECGHEQPRFGSLNSFGQDIAYSQTRWIEDGEDEENKENMIIEQVNRMNRLQPHCHITIKCTKEIAGFNGLSDAFKRLDFRNAVHDVRRFNYICKLLDLLITHKLTMLSGCAQKVLFNMLEEVAYQVSVSQQNIHLLNKLLRQLQLMIDCACWGRPLGSTVLWQSHCRTIDRILTIANTIEIREPGDDVFPKLENLPEECVREVLLRLADHKDLENSKRAYSVMARLVDEQRIWRELCQFHFTHQQVSYVMEQMEPEKRQDWQIVYHKLRKQYGLKEEYAEMIQLCRNCRCLFWKSIGHPCIIDQDQDRLMDDSLYIPIPPQAFLKFFSL